MHVKIRKRIGNPTLYNAKINYSHINSTKILPKKYYVFYNYLIYNALRY